MIRRCDLFPQYKLYRDEINEAIKNVLESGRYTLANNVETFENEFANYIGSKFGIGVNSGTDALVLAMQAVGIGKGDEVITTPFTAIPTYSAIKQVNAKPIFVDIDPNTFLIDIKKIKEKVTENTKAILPVHLFGNVVDINKIRDIIGPKIPIIEDCAQVHGGEISDIKAGALGDLAAFSFYPTKNLGGYGDGGMILTNNSDYFDYLIRKRQYGMINKDEFVLDGVNTRLDELQASILRVKLKYLDHMNEQRATLAKTYVKNLDNNYIRFQEIKSNVKSAYHVFSVVCKSNRDGLVDYLKKNNIETNIYYPMALNRQIGFKKNHHNLEIYPNAENVSKSIIALPFYPELENRTIEMIANKINNYFSMKN